MVVCLERVADLHIAQLMPLPLTVSCFSKIQIGFAFLVPAHPGSPTSPGKRAVKRVCVCVCVVDVVLAGQAGMEGGADRGRPTRLPKIRDAHQARQGGRINKPNSPSVALSLCVVGTCHVSIALRALSLARSLLASVSQNDSLSVRVLAERVCSALII